MCNIEYVAMDQAGLDYIGPLWEKLREHHISRAGDLAFFFNRTTYTQRREGLLKIAAAGKMRVDLVRDVDSGRYAGYCITSLSPEMKGEIESIYVEPEYRGQGAGDRLMRRSLEYLDEQGAQRKVLAVAVGNEDVFRFYGRYGFVPRVTMLEQAPNPE
jgi:diamine N-acetyltransferase